MPLGLTVTTLAVLARSFHMTLPLPFPSVRKVLPSGPVITATSGDFSPGAMPGPLGRLASMAVMGRLSKGTLSPNQTCTLAHPLSASKEATPRQVAQPWDRAWPREAGRTDSRGRKAAPIRSKRVKTDHVCIEGLTSAKVEWVWNFRNQILSCKKSWLQRFESRIRIVPALR